MFGAAQELPLVLIPLSIGTLGSHRSLLRARMHYPSDIIAGGAIALAVSATAWKLCPPHRTRLDRDRSDRRRTRRSTGSSPASERQT
jgi:hypothetical protein